jgi:hypothetical protein
MPTLQEARNIIRQTMDDNDQLAARLRDGGEHEAAAKVRDRNEALFLAVETLKDYEDLRKALRAVTKPQDETPGS